VYVAWRAGTIPLFLLGSYIAPIDFLKIPALKRPQNRREGSNSRDSSHNRDSRDKTRDFILNNRKNATARTPGMLTPERTTFKRQLEHQGPPTGTGGKQL
jgi:hypothetical protein